MEEIARHATANESKAATAVAHSLKGAAGIVTAGGTSIAGGGNRTGRPRRAIWSKIIASRSRKMRREMRQCLDYIPA